MKIFVAGAAGAIGRPMIAALVRDGHTVTAMNRDESVRRRSSIWAPPWSS